MGVLGYLLQCDMLLHAKSVSIREKTFFYPETSLFCKKACRFRDFCVPLPTSNIIVRSRTKGGERRPSNNSGHFLCSYFRGLQVTSSHQ